MPTRTPFRLTVVLEPHQRPDTPSWRHLLAAAREADPDLISLVDPVGGVSERIDAREGVAGPAVRRPVPRASPPRFGEAPEALEVVHPAQGGPVVLALARSDHGYRIAARVADAVVITAVDTAEIRELVSRVRAAEHEVGRGDRPLPVLAALAVTATDDGPVVHAGDRVVAAGPDATARVLGTWRAAGLDGVRLRPAVLPDDLEALARLIPGLRAAGLRPPARSAPSPADRDAAIGADR